MEEMLSGAQEGAIKAMQLTQSQETLKFNDHAFIQASALLVRASALALDRPSAATVQ